MKNLLIGLVLQALACGFPTATHCDNTPFGRGVDSVLLIDCDLISSNFEDGVRQITAHAKHVDIDLYRRRMGHVHLEVRSVYRWTGSYGTVIGLEHPDPFEGKISIVVDKYGMSVTHETLHAYDDVGYWNNVGSILAYPFEASSEGNHDGWLSNCTDAPNDMNCGYYDAANDYEDDCLNGTLDCQLLQPRPPDGPM